MAHELTVSSAEEAERKEMTAVYVGEQNVGEQNVGEQNVGEQKLRSWKAGMEVARGRRLASQEQKTIHLVQCRGAGGDKYHVCCIGVTCISRFLSRTARLQCTIRKSPFINCLEDENETTTNGNHLLDMKVHQGCWPLVKRTF
jgi:hypothetical protein